MKKAKKIFAYFVVAAIMISALSILSFAADTDNVFDAKPIGEAKKTVQEGFLSLTFDNPIVIIVFSVCAIAVAAAVTYAILKSKSQEYVRHEPRRSANEDDRLSNTAWRPIEEYREVDPSFDEKAFCEMASNLFVKLQECRTTRDFTEIEPYLSTDMHEHFKHEYKVAIMQGQRLVIEQPKVNKAEIKGFKRGSMHDHIKLRLEVSLIKYKENSRSGHRISGSRDKVLKKKYDWDMRRRRNDVLFGDQNGEEKPENVWKLSSYKSLLKK